MKAFSLVAFGLALVQSQPAMADLRISGTQNSVIEFNFHSSVVRSDPFNQVQLDVVFADPRGSEYRVPAFWSGDQLWKVRYASSSVGEHRFRTVCNDTADSGLHGQNGVVEVHQYDGANILQRRGAIQVSSNNRYFVHADGTPFFWLGDTWWMGLCHRLRWPEDFRLLTADRVRKGFTVVQIVAGLYPDMPPFDPRGANEAGYPWSSGYGTINPAYFDMADLRIQYLVDQGIVPCIVGSWGYFLPKMGKERVQQHWRYLIARWGAYPVVWCLAGEGTMPDYLSTTKEQDSKEQKMGWTTIARYVRTSDPYHRMISIHPSQNSRDSVEDQSALDFDMLQTGHSDRASLPNTVRSVAGSRARQPVMPVINAEPCYEGILEAGRQEVQRLLFWSCMLSGAAGHTYGANGLWQVNTASRPYGPSPHGRSWGDTPWEEAYQLPGSEHLGLSKGLLIQYSWWEFEPHPEWVEPHWSSENYIMPYAAGIPGKVRVIYSPARWDLPKVVQLEAGTYHGFLFNPVKGNRIDLGLVHPDEKGNWQPPVPPVVQDWVLVLERNQP